MISVGRLIALSGKKVGLCEDSDGPWLKQFNLKQPNCQLGAQTGAASLRGLNMLRCVSGNCFAIRNVLWKNSPEGLTDR